MEDAGGGANGDVLANLAAELALGAAACRQNRAEIWGCFFFSWRGKGEGKSIMANGRLFWLECSTVARMGQAKTCVQRDPATSRGDRLRLSFEFNRRM